MCQAESFRTCMLTLIDRQTCTVTTITIWFRVQTWTSTIKKWTLGNSHKTRTITSLMTITSSCKLSRKCRIVYWRRATSSSRLKVIKMSILGMICLILWITSTSTLWLISPSSVKSKGKVWLIWKQMYILNQAKIRAISILKLSQFLMEEMASLVQTLQFNIINWIQSKSWIAKLKLYKSQWNLLLITLLKLT